MSTNITIKSSIRQPIRLLFLFLLVGMSSFAFIAKTVEYIIVQQETGRLGSYYRSIGSLERFGGDGSSDVSTGASLIQKSPYLAYEDRRRYSTGVMPAIWNPDGLLIGFDSNGIWFYGTLINRQAIVIKDDPSTSPGYALTFVVDKVLAGFPDNIHAGNGSAISLAFLFKGHEDAISTIGAMELGQRYLIRGWKDVFFQSDPNWLTTTSNFQIRALDDAELWYIPVASTSEVDLNDAGMAGIKNEIDILNENQHTFLLIGTADMSALPEMQESSHIYYLAAGRWLNHQDDLKKSHVIVVQREFADKQKLKVGDSLTMTLRGLNDPFAPYIQGKNDRANWRSYPTYKVAYRIVGLYDDLLGLETENWMYVPNSSLPADAVYPDSVLYADSYSFVLDSPQQQETFVNRYKNPLAQMGFRFNFVENNGVEFWAAVTPLRRSALTGLMVYSLVLLVGLTLGVFLYLGQRRKDFAILRILGVSKVRVTWQILLPLVLIGVAGVLVGGIPAWTYSLQISSRTLSQLPTPAGIQPSTTLNPLVLFALCGGLLLLFVSFAWVGIRVLAGKPVLELLGGAAPARVARQQTRAPVSKPGAMTAATEIPVGLEPFEMPRVSSSTKHRLKLVAKSKSSAVTSALAQFGFRYIKRSAVKSILTTLVALGLVFTLGWIHWNIEQNRAEIDHLYATTLVKAEIVQADPSMFTPNGDGFIAQGVIDRMLDSGFIQSAYVEAADYTTAAATYEAPTLLLDIVYPLSAFDQPEKYFSKMVTRNTVMYAPGWGESLFTKDWTSNELKSQGVPAVFPDSFLKNYNLKLGDTIYFYELSHSFYPYRVAGQYTPGFQQISGNIIGGEVNGPILLPLSALKVIQKNNIYYTTAQFVIDPAKNRELQAFEQEMSTMISGSGAGKLPLKIHFWDEELRAVVAPLEKNLLLLQVLYPATLAVSVFIGVGLCLLLSLQLSHEASLLRMLGITKNHVQILLGCEQFLLSMAGALVGLGLSSILYKSIEAVLAWPMLMSSGLYIVGAFIGSLMGAIMISNKRPMQLLQVKE